MLQIWKARKAIVRDEIAAAERATKAIQEKLDRLDEAFLFERSIDIEAYDGHAEKLREELTLARIDSHSGQLEELDVEGILAFAEMPSVARREPVGAGVEILAASLRSSVKLDYGLQPSPRLRAPADRRRLAEARSPRVRARGAKPKPIFFTGSTAMTVDVDVWLRGQDFATTRTIEGVDREPRAWTDDDVRLVLEGMLRIMQDIKHPTQGRTPVVLRGLSWIVNPYEEGGVVIAIEITMGAAIAGPFDIEQAALESMIARVIREAASPGISPTIH